MSLFKCKMCGGELHVEEGMKVAECEYCGSSQTISSSNDDKILKLYARGNLLRTQNDFDKAYNIFEQIIVENPQDAEGYWNLLLCKYGITYVDDYDGSKKPTINRMSMTSIKDDQDYIKVLEYADVVSKAIYKQQITEIARIQEDILKIVKNEEPYDIFISYKETDEFGDRTEDSVLAQEIYDTLTKEGYKVFLSRVTLANAIGSEYEPYIYSALYSSKLMVLVTTKEEYVNAVWVKNEWSRFLKMMKEDSSKKIIPCFKHVDPYDLPKEIRNIQSVNFDKLGAIQDLVIGVNKILGKKKENVSETVHNPTNSEVNSLLKRVNMFLEDREWEKANEYCEKVLDIDPENAQAYLYKFFIEYKVHGFSEIELLQLNYDITQNSNFEKAMRFADETQKKELALCRENEAVRLRKLSIFTTKAAIDRNNLKHIIVDKDIVASAMSGSTSIETVEILEGVVNIGKEAFKKCTNLKTIIIPSSVVNIEENAFQGCIKLTSVVIPPGVRNISNNSFEYCSNLTSIEIPPSVTNIGKFAFSGCVNLKNVIIPPSVTNIGEFAFSGCINLKSVIIPPTVTDIGKAAFSGCRKLENIEIPLNLKNIEEELFFGCYSLTSINIPKDVTNIGNFAFKECCNLESIIIPSSVTNIGEGVFEGCDELTTITIPEGIKNIEQSTFAKCSNLTNVTIPSTITSIGNFAFQQCHKLVNITMPPSVTKIGELAFGGCRNLTNVILQEGLITIGQKAFQTCENLMNVTIPNSVTNIGEMAFGGCEKLTSIIIPNSITSIEEGVFGACSNLRNVTISSSVRSVGKSAFVGCGNLTSVTIPSSVMSIEELAFGGCSSLTNVKILSSAIKIHETAFYGCPCESQVRNRAASSSIPTSRPTTSSYSSYSTSSKKGGCYVATCVYGSYDCPEVWTLRRFRDDTLGSTWYGRMFIRVYYAISPKLVKWFGNKKWFKKIWKNTLDRMVDKLKSKGVENTPYDDKKW